MMSKQTFDAEAYVRAAAPAVGLDVSASDIAPVAAQIERIHAFAELMLDLALAPGDEAAPRFEP